MAGMEEGIMEILISDLTPEAQARILTTLHLASAEEGNLDVFPLCIVDEPNDD